MKSSKVLITGGAGMLARSLASVLADRGSRVTALDRSRLDVTNASQVHDLIVAERPDIVVQCAAYTRVDDAEENESLAFAVNGQGTANVAVACREIGARFVYPSTDYVFDGTARSPYPVEATPSPLNAYGRSKLAGEIAARNARDFLIVRTCWLYGPGGRNFVRSIAERLEAGQPLRVVNDQQGAPTWTHDLAETIAALLRAEAPPGVYHATNAGSTTWYELACEVARLMGREQTIEPCSSADYPARARRPAYSVLDCSTTARSVATPRDWRLALAEAVKSGAY